MGEQFAIAKWNESGAVINHYILRCISKETDERMVPKESLEEHIPVNPATQYKFEIYPVFETAHGPTVSKSLTTGK